MARRAPEPEGSVSVSLPFQGVRRLVESEVSDEFFDTFPGHTPGGPARTL
jgi:hypothetical protein